jgi:hypothetical protein
VGMGATTGHKLRGTIMESAGARAYMGLAALPSVGSRGKVPGEGVRGHRPPLKLKPIYYNCRR